MQTAGVVAIIAASLAMAVATKEMARHGLASDVVGDFLWPALVAGLIGARLAYVLLLDPTWYATRPWQIVAVWKGGMAEEGAFLGGLGAAIWWCRKREIPFLVFADALAPALALGGAIAHLGAFLGGAGYGAPTAVSWAVTVTDPRSSAPLGIPLHPTQLYESGADLAFLGILLTLRRRIAHPGQLFLLFLLGSALVRLAVDSVKGDVIVVLADRLTSGQLVAAIVVVGASAGLVRLGRHSVAGLTAP